MSKQAKKISKKEAKEKKGGGLRIQKLNPYKEYSNGKVCVKVTTK